MCGKKREPPPHNLESAERGREGALLETRPRASQGMQSPAAPPLRGVVPECRRQDSPRSLVILVAARTRTRRGVAKNTPAGCPARHNNGPGRVTSRKELELLG